jgi:hypothetical protein
LKIGSEVVMLIFWDSERGWLVEMFILRKECARGTCMSAHKRYNMHGLKQQNAFGWTDITCTCLIYLFLFLFECHFTSFWPPKYINWNIVQSGIKHHKPTNLFLNPKISTWPLLNLFNQIIIIFF